MNLKDIAALSGKGGLFKVLSAGKGGMVLESLENKARLVVPVSQKVFLLSDLSIYTTTAAGTEPLSSVLKKIHTSYGVDTGIDAQADATELHAFFKSVLPEYDTTRVYASDIRKLIKWYGLLIKHAPEVFTEQP